MRPEFLCPRTLKDIAGIFCDIASSRWASSGQSQPAQRALARRPQRRSQPNECASGRRRRVFPYGVRSRAARKALRQLNTGVTSMRENTGKGRYDYSGRDSHRRNEQNILPKGEKAKATSVSHVLGCPPNSNLEAAEHFAPKSFPSPFQKGEIGRQLQRNEDQRQCW
jgi:hypothetical protein